MSLSHKNYVEIVFEASKLDRYWLSYEIFILVQKLVQNRELAGQNREVGRHVKNRSKFERLPSKTGDLEPLCYTTKRNLNFIFCQIERRIYIPVKNLKEKNFYACDWRIQICKILASTF